MSAESINKLWCLPFDHVFAEVATVFSFERGSARSIKQCVHCGWVQP